MSAELRAIDGGLPTVPRLRRAVSAERLLSKVELADHYGVSTSTVDNWARDGMPWHPLRGRPGSRPKRKFRLSETDGWLVETGRMG